MSNSTSANKFRPRQALQPTAENFKELVTDGGERLAAVSLEQIPPIPAGAAIHDNGCGGGSATAVIMATVPAEIAATIHVTGTDISEAAVEDYRTRSAALAWPAQGQVMNADELSFPDEVFTHSIGNALLFVGPRNNGVDAVKEMRRTLRPGGRLIVNSFAEVPNLEPVREASRMTRSPNTLPAWSSFEEWTDPAVLARVVEAGGFKKEDVTVRQCEMFVNVGDFKRHIALLWSLRGETSDGWSIRDEEKWEDAVEIVRREIERTKGFSILADGSAKVRFLINVATAIKN